MAITNTLISRILNVKTAGESYKDSNMYKNKKDEIEKIFLPSFAEISTKFNSIYISYRALEKICCISIDFELVKNNIAILKTKVTKDEYDRGTVTILKRELDKIEIGLASKWKEYINERTSAINGILETLDKLIADMPEKQLLKNKKLTITTAKIGSSVAMAAIEEYIIIYNNLMNKLNLKDSVLSFLKLLTSENRVTFNDMNSEVYEWIKTSEFAGKINLKIV